MKSLPTITTVETDRRLTNDIVRIDGRLLSGRELARVRMVVNGLRAMTHGNFPFLRIESRNPEVDGKGLGFSSSGFAALGLASSKALDMNIDVRHLSEIVRLGAGSAARSLVGGFSIWYANRGGKSYAKQLASPSAVRLVTLIIPVPSKVKTERAHEDVVRSPFYKARLKYVRLMLEKMKSAIYRRDVETICMLAEVDTLNLHAVTMTGPSGMVLLRPITITVMDEVRRLREEEETPAWFSLDTGPSVFVNTTPEALPKVRRRLAGITRELLVSSPGGAAELLDKHLF